MKWLRIGVDGGHLWTGSHTLGFLQKVEFDDLLSNYQFSNYDTVPPASKILSHVWGDYRRSVGLDDWIY
jgi:hypothetical protein